MSVDLIPPEYLIIILGFVVLAYIVVKKIDLLKYFKISSKGIEAGFYEERQGEYLNGIQTSPRKEMKSSFETGLKLYRQEQYKKALQHFKGALEKNPSDEEKIAIYNSLGLCNHHLGNFDEAIEQFEYLLHHTENDIIKAVAFGNLSRVYNDKGEWEMALTFSKDALKISRERGNRFGEAVALANIGSVYLGKGELEKSIEYSNEALKMNKEMRNRVSEAINLENIGNAYSRMNEPEKALSYCEEALEKNRLIFNRERVASNLRIIGNIHKNKGEYKKALRYHEDALEIDRQIGNRLGEASDLSNVGSVYQLSGDLDRALKYYTKGLEIFKDLGAKQYTEILETEIARIKNSASD